MIKDTQLVFSGTIAAGAAATRSGQSITVDAISTNVIDLRNAATPALVDEGLTGSDMWLMVIALTAAAGGDSAKTLDITLESDSTADLATSATVHGAAAQVTGAGITAGAVLWRTKLPSGDYERYLGIRYNVSATFTAFTVAAFLTPDIARNVIYPSGFTVDA